MTQTTVHLTNSGIEEPIDNGVPAPKFAPDQEVTFQLTYTISAVIDGEGWWAEDTKEYLYSVKDAKALESPANIYLKRLDLEVDAVNSVHSEDDLRANNLTVKSEITPDLPSCEFDPN
jgi:hypothetical protein